MRAQVVRRFRHMIHKSLLFCGTAIAAFAFTACDDDYGYHDDRPGYYADAYDSDADFYYVESRPYSRSYGPLILRDGG